MQVSPNKIVSYQLPIILNLTTTFTASFNIILLFKEIDISSSIKKNLFIIVNGEVQTVVPIIHAGYPCQSSVPVIHESHPCQLSMPVMTPPPLYDGPL